MAFAGQTPRTLSALRQLNTTLLLDIDRRLWSRSFGLWLILLFLLLRSGLGILGLALLALSRHFTIRTVSLSRRFGTRKALFLAFAFTFSLLACRGVAGVFGFLLLPLLLLLL